MTITRERKFGNLGEDIACEFLKKHGFEVIERNYLRKWGEIDIVARKAGRVRFVEVKSVAHGTHIRAEENMHPGKLRRLSRVVQTYIMQKRVDCDWQIDLITVKINDTTRSARVELIENIL